MVDNDPLVCDFVADPRDAAGRQRLRIEVEVDVDLADRVANERDRVAQTLERRSRDDMSAFTVLADARQTFGDDPLVSAVAKAVQ